MRWAVAVLVAAAVSVTGAFAQDQPDATWRTVVERYIAGDVNEAVSAAVTIPADGLRADATRAFDEWRPGGTRLLDGARTQVIKRLQVSALLPIELLYLTGRLDLPEPAVVALEDVATEAWRRLAAFESERNDPEAAAVRRFRVRWRFALIAHLLANARYAECTREIAKTRVPADDTDARVMFDMLRGIDAETRARLTAHVSPEQASYMARRPAQGTRVWLVRNALAVAADSYRKVLAQVPGDREATLRLARVAIERERFDEAASLLTPLLQTPCPDVICGLAWLFAGDLHEARRDPAQASAAFARASSVPSVRAAALMALVQGNLRRGDTAAAYALTTQFTAVNTRAAGHLPNAWLAYTGGHPLDPGRGLPPLRAEVVR
ncbi:MAG: tetratricopeptide repeat protein [Acidobacteria bacterium]|nr:tetratricopeptide repeat protein [Acidobacteriota bacterium]